MIFGGRSEIGLELATRLAPGMTVVLAARGADRLEAQLAAVRDAGAAAVHAAEFDADDLASHGTLVEKIVDEFGPIGTAVLAFGILGDQDRAETDAAHAVAIVHTDYVAQISLLTHLATAMRTAGRGALVVFSSVAGSPKRRLWLPSRPQRRWARASHSLICASASLSSPKFAASSGTSR